MTTVDAGGRARRIVEKAPVLTELTFDDATVFPFELWLRGEHLRMDGSAVVVRLAQGTSTTDGCSELTFASTDVRWL
ncbi:hypothetical protein GCM10022197_14120 [Microlunatus spumicola]|uniref:Uncharacterized protein n=1 Tax=Microlunatus spumicola TaxID=81499 RepID=A0ABP6X119_9ACTN